MSECLEKKKFCTLLSPGEGNKGEEEEEEEKFCFVSRKKKSLLTRREGGGAETGEGRG